MLKRRVGWNQQWITSDPDCWKATTYDSEDNILDEWEIHNRTEDEAIKEVSYDACIREVSRWTLVDLKERG